MTKVEFRASKAAPYSLRDVERVFKKYSTMLYQVNQVVLAPKEPPKPVIKKVTKPKPVVTKQKIKTEDSLDEGFTST
jgi:hypothetical protein